MTLTEAKTLLEKKRIPYQTAQYEDEDAYWRHLMPFPGGGGRKCKITALVIPSVNGEKDIELQFNRTRGEYRFAELYFGSYSFDMFDTDPDLLAADLLDIIGQIVDGRVVVISASDLKKKRWKGDSCFDPTDSDSVFGAPGLRDAMAEVESPKTIWKKLTGSRIQYEIYDWRTYRQVVK